MFAKHEEIDLNADAVSGDRENEGDAHVIGDSVAETLMEPCKVQGEVQGSDDAKVRVFDSAMVMCDLNVAENDVHKNSEGVDSDADILCKVENEGEKGSEYLDREIDANAEESNRKCGDDVSMHDGNEVEKGSEQLDRGVHAKTDEICGKCGEDVSMHAENEVKKGSELLDRGVDAKAMDNNEKCGADVSMLDVNEVEGSPVAVRASSEAAMHCDMNVSPVREESEQGTHGRDTIELLHQKFGEATSDELENKVVEVDTEIKPDELEEETNDGDKVQSLHQKFKEATFDVLGSKAMEVDTQTKLDSTEDQLVGFPVSEELESYNVLNNSHVINLVVDLHPYMEKDGNASGEVNAKFVTSRSEFREGDLVWGKVRSHPWWPGQIFNLSAASQKANKYYKKDSYLIAYFGDQTFAWNDASKIKLFQEHFAHMEKQTTLKDFHYAVDCTLEEVARRVEFGLACSCIPEEAYAKLKTQVIVNPGIREESSRRDGGGDSFSNAASFEPLKLLGHIKKLALLQYYSEVDRLGIVTVKAQLSAFYRRKGYLQLPEFNMLGELLETDAEIPLSGWKSGAETGSFAPDFNGEKKAYSDMVKLKSQGGSSHKWNFNSADSIRPRKKEKSLSDLLAERRASMSNVKRGTNGKADELMSLSSGKKRKVDELMSVSCGKKHKSVNSLTDDRVVKHKKDSISADMSEKSNKLCSISDNMSLKHKKGNMLVVKHENSDSSVGAACKYLPMKKTFGVGNSMVKVANQLNRSSPIFKSGDVTSQKTVVRNKSNQKSLYRKSQSKKQFPSEETSPAELLSQLCLAARDPMEGYNLLISLVSFFLDFRNSVSLEQFQEGISGDKTGETWTNSETTGTSGLEPVKDTYWTDRIIQNIPENINEAGEILHEIPSQKDIFHVESTSAVQSSAHLESALLTAGGIFEQEAVKPADPLDGCSSEDHSPTALILNFTDLDSVPSKDKMIKIFSRFGPLNELGTEVKKSKRAEVVFKRRADAETAFSSAGKYSIFGPSLVSYCLEYVPSTPSKTSS